MLTAPTGPPNLFDPNSMRTGFTPQVTSNTWGPDTPGTAAFFASLTHATPDAPATMASGAAGVAVAARQHRDGPNHFEANFARAISGTNLPTANPDVSLYQTQPVPRPLGAPGALPPSTATMTAAVMAARAGEASMYGQHNPLYLLSQGVAQHELANSADDTVIAAAALSKLTSSAQQGYNMQPHLGQAPPIPTMAPMQPMPLAPAANGAPQQQQRPPTLQPRKGRTSTNGVGSPPNSAASASTPTGRKRKGGAAVADIETAKPPKAARNASGKRAVKARSESVDFDEMGDFGEDDGEEEGGSPRSRGNASGRPETDEEKRKNFLERNRQGASRVRLRAVRSLKRTSDSGPQVSAAEEGLAAELAGQGRVPYLGQRDPSVDRQRPPRGDRRPPRRPRRPQGLPRPDARRRRSLEHRHRPLRPASVSPAALRVMYTALCRPGDPTPFVLS
jgi:hypothetical protein